MFFRASKKKQPKIETHPLPLAAPMLALEPRYVFDAALAGDIHDQASQLSSDHTSSTGAAESAANLVAATVQLRDVTLDHGGASDSATDRQVSALIDALVDGHNAGAADNEIAFIDSRLNDLSGIIGAIPAGTRIVMIDAGRDGVSQMIEALRGQTGVTGIHIVSHGQAGSLQLGSSTLDANTMSTVYKQALESINSNLAETADILVYGCDFGAGDAGAAATALLSELTGADVASSDDLTGAADQGGDWDLERRSGAIDADTINAAGWNDTLAATNSGSWTVSGLTATNTTAGITTTITFTPNSANSAFGSVANQTFNTIPVFSNGADGNPSLSFVYTWDTTPEPIVTLPQPQASTDSGIGTVTITFSQPVTNPIINLDRLGGNSAYDPNTLVTGDEESISNGARWTLTSGGTLTKISGTSHFDVTSSTIERTPNQAMSYTGTSTESGTNPLTNTAAGSVRVNGTFTTITFQLTGVGVEGGGQDGIELGVIVDPPPNANNDALAVAEDGTLTGNLYANNGSGTDADPQGDTITITHINGASFTVGTPILLANGSLTITNATTGAFTFIPNANYNGSQAFDYTISDPAGGTDTATATISITAVNDPPVATPSTSSGNEDTPISLDLSGTDIDGTISSVKVTTLPPAAQGVLYMPDGTTPVVAGAALTPAQATTLVFKPALNFNGTVTIPFTVTDNSGAVSSPVNEVITVNPVNDPPVATPGTSSGNEDTPIAVDLTGTDVDGTVTAVTVTTLPPAAQGILYMPDGTTPVVAGTPMTPAQAANLVFAPALNFNGNVTIPFTVTDNSGAISTPSNEVISVNAVKYPPVGVNDTIPVTEDTPVTQNVLSNDTDIENDSLTIASATIDFDGDGDQDPLTLGTATAITNNLGNSIGTITVNANGNVTFTPALNYTGPVPNLTYTPKDAANGSPATVSFGPIAPVNDPPVATPGTSSGNEDTPIAVNLAGTDVDGTVTAVTVTTLPPAAQGILYMPDGTTPVVAGTPMTPAQASTLVFAPALNFNGSVTIPFTVTDNNGAISTPANELITVAPVNDPPVGVNNTIPVTEDTPVTLNVLSNDTDIENDSLTIASATIDFDGDGDQDPLTLGTATAITNNLGNPIGTITVNANGDVTFAPALNYTGPVPDLTYTPKDAANGSPATVSFGPIAPVNDPPVATPGTSSGNEDTPIAVDLTGTDVDGTIASVTVTTLPPAAQGILYMPDGTTPVVAGTPIPAAQAANLVFVPAANFNGSVAIPFTVTDDDGATSAPANEVITVNDVNDPPVAIPSTSSGNEDTNIPVDLTGTDVDGTVASVTVTTLPPLAQGILYMPDGTTPVVAGTPIPAAQAANLVFAPTLNFNGTVTIPFIVTDDDGATSAPAKEVITVIDVNDPPVATPSTSSGNEDTNIPVDLTGTDVDGTVASVTVTTLPPAAQGILYMPDGTTPAIAGTPLTPAQAANLVFAPAPNFNGSVTIPFIVTDDDGAVSTPANEVITVNDVNDPPVATSSTSSGNEDTNIPVDLTGTDVDGTVASVTVTTLPPLAQGILYMPDGTTPVVAGTPLTPAQAANLVFAPALNFNGTVTIPFIVTDDDGAVSTPSNEVITVTPVNDVPVAHDDATSTAYNVPIVIDFLGNDIDPDSDPLTVVSASVAPNEGTLTNAGGVWTFTPNLTFTGTATITYTIEDPDGETSTATHSVAISNVPPVMIVPVPGGPFVNPADPSNLIVPAFDGGLISINLGDYFSDPNSHTLSFTPNLAGLPAWITYDPVSQTLSGRPPGRQHRRSRNTADGR